MSWYGFWYRHIRRKQLEDVISENNILLLRQLLSVERDFYPPDELDIVNTTPLFSATCGYHFACAAELLKAGANVNFITASGSGGFGNETPLLAAVTREHYAAIPLFLYWGADFNRQRCGDKPIDRVTVKRALNKYLRGPDQDVRARMEKFQENLTGLHQMAQEIDGLASDDLTLMLTECENLAAQLYEAVHYEKWLLDQYLSPEVRLGYVRKPILGSCREAIHYFSQEALKYYNRLAEYFFKKESTEPKQRNLLVERLKELSLEVHDQTNPIYQAAQHLLKEEERRYERPIGLFDSHRTPSTASSRSDHTSSGEETDAISSSIELHPLPNTALKRHIVTPKS